MPSSSLALARGCKSSSTFVAIRLYPLRLYGAEEGHVKKGSDSQGEQRPMKDSPELYYDPYDVGINANPYPVYRRLREEAPLYYNARHDFYAVSRFDDVSAAWSIARRSFQGAAQSSSSSRRTSRYRRA
jgi:hypothetical protein